MGGKVGPNLQRTVPKVIADVFVFAQARVGVKVRLGMRPRLVLRSTKMDNMVWV
jgi:hypothetical protein